ncbi:nuclear exosome regulator NRDE2 [Sporobolomyces salmoneus]|uniref:nuclear exosome regulator NRDE2 n=1 Tax=Sporobolomyces salmoneus TaxID=183962 RepID=UPI00317B71FC
MTTGSISSKVPPSFSSFPAPEPPSKPHDKVPPPSFTSFPTPDLPGSASRRTERTKAKDFLDELGAEIGITEKKERKRNSGDHPHHRERRKRESDDDDEDEEERRRRRKTKGKEREREREEISGKERKREDESRHSSSRRERSKGKERDRDKHEDKLKRNESYRVVQASKPSLTHDDDVSPFSAPAVIEEKPREKPLFYESRKGDDLNIVYGGLHRGDVPRYYRLGAGRVVGLNDGLRITRETAYTGRGVEVAPLNRYKTPRYADPSSAKYINDKNMKRINLLPPPTKRQAQILGESPGPPLPPSPPPEDLDAPFIAFLPERYHRDKLSSLEHEEGTEYRSIAGLVKDSDLDLNSGDDEEEEDDLFGTLGISGGESQDEYLKRRNIELDRQLRDNPKDVDGWIEFVEFQDQVTQRLSSSSKVGLSQAERTSTNEIKLAILTRALSIEGNESNERLLLAFLRAAAQVEDPKKVLERWRETLKSHPDLTGLWIEYVSWRQTSWVNFSVKDVVEDFEECLDVLMLAMLREDIGSSGLEIIEGNAIYLFLRLCLMLRQVGYSERAFAAFQALIELNLFRPNHLNLARPDDPRRKWTDRVVDELEEFWDSEAPRIGETGAKGWMNTNEDDLPPESATSEALVPSTSDDDAEARPFEKWATAERAASLNSALPARTTDPTLDDSEDPFRIVLFDDIRSFLFIVHSPDSNLQLAYAFLTFLGLPFVPPDFPTSTPFTTDSFIHSELVERPSLVKRFWPKKMELQKPFETIGGEAMEPERKSALGTPFEIPFRATPAVVDQLFPAKGKGEWFATIRKEDLEDIEIEQARNALGLLTKVVRDPFLNLDLFALEAASSPKGAVKAAKQILKDHRTDLALWDGYARIERQRGKVSDARQVYCTALSMYRSFKPQDQIDGPLLWRSWAEMEWEEGNTAIALKVLVAASSNAQVDLASLAKSPETRPSPAEILRARQYYSTQLEASFQPRATESILRNRNHLAYSSALLALLTQGLDSATEILERQLFRLDCVNAKGTAEHEEVYMLHAKLLYRNSMKGAYKPTRLRDVLERATGEYRNNTLFLGLFYHNELRMKIQNRIRKTLEDHVLKEQDATSEGYLFAIFAELHLDARSQNLWAVRNLFDRAVENPKTKSSPSIWTLYIDYEVRNGELQRAKSLIYRALRECPWCQEFYLRPFSPTLRSVYRSSELRDFHHLLLEKGLRVRIDLDPYLEGAQFSDVEMLENDEEEDREGEGGGTLGIGEEVFVESKKLMPY